MHLFRQLWRKNKNEAFNRRLPKIIKKLGWQLWNKGSNFLVFQWSTFQHNQDRLRPLHRLEIWVINSSGQRQFCLYHFLRYDWSSQNQNKLTWPREDWNYSLSCSLFLSGYAVMRRGRQNRIDNKVQDRYHWLIYFYVENLIFDRHFSSVLSPCMCCTYTNVLCTHFCHLIRSVSGEMSIGHLVEGSDDWKYIYTSVSSEISTWMFKKNFSY